jgi:hypothetical protein
MGRPLRLLILLLAFAGDVAAYALVALAIAAGFLFLAIGLLFAAIVPPAAVVVVHGPYAIAWLLAIWFASRCVRGYLAFLRVAPVGAGIPDPLPVP